MAPLNLPWYVFNRPIKPVAFVLMLTMIFIGVVAFTNIGLLGSTELGDILGGMAFSTAALFIVAWVRASQIVAEWALMASIFVWGFRFWAIILTYGWGSFKTEGLYLSFFWMILAIGSWFLERADPTTSSKIRGERWTQR